MKQIVLKHFHVREGLSNDDVGAVRGTVFLKDIAGELVSKPAISLKKKLGASLNLLLKYQENEG